MTPPPVEGDAESQAHLKRLPTADQAVQDALDLAELGHAETLTRKFSLWSMFFLAFSVLGTWSTFAQGLSSGLTAGGPVAILWGLVLVFVCNICVAVSLAEMCSAMPTAMGQAYWIWRLWPGGKGRFTSYLCAWINNMKVLYDPDWDGAHGWVRFLLYLAVTAFVTLFNVVACRRDAILPMFNNFVGICFVTLFFVFSLALLISVGVKDGNSFQPASFVFGRWLNQTGWNDGVTWFLGLVQAAYGLTAFDAAIHLVEEIPAPRKNIPRVMWLSVTMGAVSGFIFMVVCLFCIQDLDAVIDPSTGLPFMDLLKGTTGLTVATVLLSFFIFNGMGQAVSIVTTASRPTWSFARDGGIPWSPYFSKVNETWRVPVRALWLQGGIIGLIGVLYTFADTVLEAILGVSVIALTVSYGMPVLVLLMVGRDKLPPAEFKLGRFGTLINWISVFYCAITMSLGFWVTKGRLTYLRASEAEEIIIEARRTELSQAAADHPGAEGTGDVKDTIESFRERRQS
ncbi:hypothetical protein VdG1_00321 [Verticillium dahliae VDG1]|nr:hypothetical protein VdG1_00321 [Verticillium dahliae VDG1]